MGVELVPLFSVYSQINIDPLIGHQDLNRSRLKCNQHLSEIFAIISSFCSSGNQVFMWQVSQKAHKEAGQKNSDTRQIFVRTLCPRLNLKYYLFKNWNTNLHFFVHVNVNGQLPEGKARIIIRFFSGVYLPGSQVALSCHKVLLVLINEFKLSWNLRNWIQLVLSFNQPIACVTFAVKNEK